MAKSKRQRQGFGLVQYDVPESALQVAAKRIRPHLEWVRLVDYDMRRLLTNVYLQGLEDMAEAIIRQKLDTEL